MQDNKGRIGVKNLSQHAVGSMDEGLKLAEFAKSRRQVSGTTLNGVSSRSHSVCQLELCRPGTVVNTVFWIVDLAGSERSKRTGTKSTQQKEASGINTSLMKLWRCLKQIRSNQQSKSKPQQVSALSLCHHSHTRALGPGRSARLAHTASPLLTHVYGPLLTHVYAPQVPFRESKLTHLFMNHLAGRDAGRTVMIVNVNPQPDDYDETQHVLNSAAIAQSVKITNDEFVKKAGGEKAATHDANGRNLKSIKENEELLNTLKKNKKKSAGSAAGGGNSGALSTENAVLRAALGTLTSKLATLEAEIREEVAEEFEDVISEIHESYAEQRRADTSRQGAPTPAKSVRKLQSERANDYVDELLEKLNECEDEMTRMRDGFLVGLKAKDEEIERLGGKVIGEENATSPMPEAYQEIATGIDTDGTVEYELEEEEEEEEEEEVSEEDFEDWRALFLPLLFFGFLDESEPWLRLARTSEKLSAVFM